MRKTLDQKAAQERCALHTAKELHEKADGLIFTLRMMACDADGLTASECYAARKECQTAIAALENLANLTRARAEAGVAEIFKSAEAT
jgi:uncharacterized protein YegP (UPF0339 family)